MIMYFTVDKESEDKLNCKTYRLWLSDRLEVQLDTYLDKTRPSRRHHYKVEASWSRFNSRNTIKCKPEVPDEIVLEVLAQIRAAVVYKQCVL